MRRHIGFASWVTWKARTSSSSGAGRTAGSTDCPHSIEVSVAYGVDGAVWLRRAADYVDRILEGARPGDLLIEQPTEFKLVFNPSTARALGLNVSESILIRADEVIR